MKKLHGILAFLILISSKTVNAQAALPHTMSGIGLRDRDSTTGHSDKQFLITTEKLILPTTLIAYGVLSITSGPVKNLNGSTHFEINEHQPRHITLDNYTQYTPVALVYGLNLWGVKGKHNFKDRTIIYAMSQLISTGVVLPVKYTIREERPDGSDNLSFPSGHTATAFSSAQFLFREYHDQNFWLSISGYPLAIFTAVYRNLNNKHWVGDVVAGAGVGMLSTELAYWFFPITARLLGDKKMVNDIAILPGFHKGSVSLTMIRSF